MKNKYCLKSALAVYDLNNFVSLNSLDNLEKKFVKEIEEEIASQDNPESLLIEKDLDNKKEDLFKNLSQEAQEVISIIIDCPGELSEICFAGNLDNVYISRLMKLMRKQWGQRLIVCQIFKEVFSFATELRRINHGTT